MVHATGNTSENLSHSHSVAAITLDSDMQECEDELGNLVESSSQRESMTKSNEPTFVHMRSGVEVQE